MRILDFLSVGCVSVPVHARTKDEAVQELVDAMARDGKIPDRQILLEAVLKREQSLSTAIGEGICIPHAKVEGISSPCIAIGICPEGICCDCPDAKPVKVVFLIASSARDAGAQLKILASLARYVKAPGFIAQLEAAQDPPQVLDIFRKFEEVFRL